MNDVRIYRKLDNMAAAIDDLKASVDYLLMLNGEDFVDEEDEEAGNGETV